MKVIILAGGSGTRLWPLSRQRYPKQFIKLYEGKNTLFQETFERSMKLTSIDDIYVVTNEKYKYLVTGAIEELGYEIKATNIILEPEAKNTLPAIYAGVYEVSKRDNDSVVVFPSDHMIEKNDEFIKIINESEKLTKDSLVTFGVKPNLPNTGYGYISPGSKILNAYKVKEFKEKPNLETAVTYVKNGYLWNSGIFMFNSKFFMDQVKTYANDIYQAFNSTNNVIEAFNKVERKISVDYGVMEKSKNVCVVPVDIGWNDLGSFDAFYDVFEKDENQNISMSDDILIESKNNLVYSEKSKLISVVGVDDLIIVDSKDALLICKKDKSQMVKEVVDTLQLRRDMRYEYNVKDYRPWGNYKVIEEEDKLFKIKRICVGTGKKLSYQLHYHRSEHWIVARGMAKVTIDDKVKYVCAGESIFIKPGQKHRLENPGKTSLEIIEVQMGEYLEEDDIVRFDDEYGRVNNMLDNNTDMNSALSEVAATF